MFSSCSKLSYLDLSNFDTRNVGSMTYMFDGCINLEEIKGINNFITDNVGSILKIYRDLIQIKFLNFMECL